ncbi:MAG: glycosyltransferase family 39 protein [Blastocatellia bacterium]
MQKLIRAKSELFAVAVIVAAGTALRLWSPKMSADLWYDEVFSLIVAKQPFGVMMHSIFLGGDTNPPLYTLLLHLWIKLGDSDAHVKYLSLLFGVASICAAYLVARQVGGKYAGLVACLLLAVSPMAIYYSIEARPYAIFLFLSLLSTYFFLSAIRASEHREGIPSGATIMPVGYLVATTLVLYTHWFGLLLVLIHTLGLVIYRPSTIRMTRRYALSLIVIGCSCLPLAPFLSNQLKLQASVGGFQWPGQPGLHSLLELALYTSGGRRSLALTAAFFVIACLGRAKQAPVEGSNLKRHTIFLSAYVLLPVILVYVASTLIKEYTFFVPRYFLPFLVGVYVLVGIAALRVEWKMALACVLGLAAFPVFETVTHRQPPEKPYSRIASELSGRDAPDVLIAHLSPASYYPVLHYRDSAATDKVLWDPASGGGYVIGYNVGGQMLSEKDLVAIGTASRKYKEFWVVVDPVAADPETQSLAEWFKNNEALLMVSEQQFGDVSLRHYKLLQSVSATP